MWSQRSRILWARQGDKSTKYFHSCATRRYRKNFIEGIRDEDGIWRRQLDEISKVLVKYYKTLFSSIEPSVSTNVLACVPTMINEEMNATLCQDFDASEVNNAVQQMASLKAPGPDGMPLLFYQHFWGIVNHDVTSSILDWLNSDDSLFFLQGNHRGVWEGVGNFGRV